MDYLETTDLFSLLFSSFQYGLLHAISYLNLFFVSALQFGYTLLKKLSNSKENNLFKTIQDMQKYSKHSGHLKIFKIFQFLKEFYHFILSKTQFLFFRFLFLFKLYLKIKLLIFLCMTSSTGRRKISTTLYFFILLNFAAIMYLSIVIAETFKEKIKNHSISAISLLETKLIERN